jgi:hypothetical protein
MTAHGEKKSNVVVLETREVDPLDAWLTKARDRARKVAKGIEAAGRVGHAFANLIDEAGKALKKRGE